MNGKILLFGVTEQLQERIRQTVALQGVIVQAIPPGQYHNTIGQLALFPPQQTGGGGTPLAEPMMVLCVREDKLDALLMALRHTGLPPICKAVLTPTNAGWKPEQLLAELQRERAEFMKMK